MDNKKFFDSVRHSLFGGRLEASQVEGMEAIIQCWHDNGDGRRQHLAYDFATVYHECNQTMRPVKEAYYMGAKAEAYRKTHLKYYPWYGRGFVQLTFRENYVRADKELGLGGRLIEDPDAALELPIASAILIRGSGEGWFTGKKLSTFLYPGHTDFIWARSVIQGRKRGAPLPESAEKVAGYAEHFDEAILASVL